MRIGVIPRRAVLCIRDGAMSVSPKCRSGFERRLRARVAASEQVGESANNPVVGGPLVPQFGVSWERQDLLEFPKTAMGAAADARRHVQNDPAWPRRRTRRGG
jgi:hypothetical protein